MSVSKIFSPCIKGYPDPVNSSREKITSWVQERLDAKKTRLDGINEIETLLLSVRQKLLAVDPQCISIEETYSNSRFSQLAVSIYYAFMRVFAGHEKIEKWIGMYSYLQNEKIRLEALAPSNPTPLLAIPVSASLIQEERENIRGVSIPSIVTSIPTSAPIPASAASIKTSHEEREVEDSLSETDTENTDTESEFFDCESADGEDLQAAWLNSVGSLPTTVTVQQPTPKEKLKKLFTLALGGRCGDFFVQYMLPEIQDMDIDGHTFMLTFDSRYDGKFKRIKKEYPTQLTEGILRVAKKVIGSVDFDKSEISFANGLFLQIGYENKVPLMSVRKDQNKQDAIILTKSLIFETQIVMEYAELYQTFSSISWNQNKSWS